MKKLILAFTLCAAAVAQAEFLYWTVLTEDLGTEIAASDVSKMRVGYVKNNGTDQPLWSGTALNAFSEDGLTSLGKTVDFDAETAGSWGFRVDVTGLSNEKYGFYIELLNSSGQVIGRTGHEAPPTFEYASYASLNGYIGTGEIGDVPSVSVWHGSFEAVPEPSSMALLALGAGLVGLRRKLRKNKKGKRA